MVAALAWSIASSLWYYPHSLSYFNELVGGPRHGHEHILDSNIAWGQDLLHLKKWHDEHPQDRPLHLAMYGFVNPRFVGIEWRPVEPDALEPGWYVIDVNFLRGSHHPIMDLAGQLASVYDDDRMIFQRFEPVDRIGYSLYVYHVTEDDLVRIKKAAAGHASLPSAALKPLHALSPLPSGPARFHIASSCDDSQPRRTGR